MQVYPSRKINAADLIEVAILSGIFLAAFFHYGKPELYMPTPAQWKGQVPKRIHNERIRKLTGTEETNHNVLDAIGLALWGSEHAYTKY
jgi:hypothetical protein